MVLDRNTNFFIKDSLQYNSILFFFEKSSAKLFSPFLDVKKLYILSRDWWHFSSLLSVVISRLNIPHF